MLSVHPLPLFLAVSALFVACDSATNPTTLPAAACKKWVTTPNLSSSISPEKLELSFPGPDSIYMIELEMRGNQWDTTNLEIAGRLSHHSGSRWHIDSMRGRLTHYNPDGWIRIDTVGANLIVMVASYTMNAIDSDPQTLVGTWKPSDTCMNHQILDTLITLNADHTWSSGTPLDGHDYSWKLHTFQEGELLNSELDPDLASYLSGKMVLSLGSKAFLVEREGMSLHLDQVDDGSIVVFRPQQ